MEFNDKNIYFIDTDTPIEFALVKRRLNELGSIQVKATEKRIDYLIYNENDDHDEKIKSRFVRLQKKGATVLSPRQLIEKMGFKPNPEYIDWNPYPNYDPWSGEKISLWESKE